MRFQFFFLCCYCCSLFSSSYFYDIGRPENYHSPVFSPPPPPTTATPISSSSPRGVISTRESAPEELSDAKQSASDSQFVFSLLV